MHRIPGSSFIPTSRRLTYRQFRHYGEFDKLLGDRELMSAVIHISACMNPLCRKANGKLQRWLTSNPEIPVAIIGRMEYWRSRVEGWPSRPGSAQPPGEAEKSP
jgi:hypothetical protein